jgi:hypothetical protein
MSGKMTTALVLALAACMNVSAQSDSAAEKRFTAMGIFSIPQGEFADEDNGAAETGFGAGIEYLKPLQSKNLYFAGAAYYIQNSMDLPSFEDEYYEISFEGGGWKNMGLMGGVRMTDIGGSAGFYVQGMAGLNMASVDDIEQTVYDYYYDEGYTITMSTSTATSFAFAIGAGLTFGEWDIGARYLNFGEPEFETEGEDEYGDEVEGEFKQKISMLAVTIGYRF